MSDSNSSGLGGWLLSLVEPLVRKGLAAIGLGWVTFEGVHQLLQQVRDQAMSYFGSMSGTVYDILALAGFINFVGIIFGAMAVIASLAVMSKLGRMLA